MKNIFTTKHIGQKVYSTIHGRGKITAVDCTKQHPVNVLFIDGEYAQNIAYTTTGRLHDTDNAPTLKFGWDDIPEWDYGQPTFDYVPLVLKGGETAWCYVGFNIVEVMSKRVKRLVVAATEDNRYIGMLDGKTNIETINTTYYKYAMRCSELD